jgi:CheY-like chemotaxis protein/MinD-like ATPase involved in chromosome partitioning or flagellar assembly
MAEKILVVDDDVDSLKLIGLTLQRQGFEISAASTGKQALEKARSELPDLVILDVMMPDMDGVEVCRRLRAESSTKAISVIMFTAKAMVDDKVAGFEAGADDYLTKPTHPAELVSRVKALLARRAAALGTPREQSSGIVYGFLGAKGGVGLTTLAMNVAAGLTGRGTTSLVDFRLGQGSLGLMLGQARSSGVANILNKQVAEINAKAIESEMVVHNSGVRLLLSSARPKEANLNASPEAVSQVVKTLRGMTKNVVVDMGAGMTRYNARLAKEVDQLVLVVEPFRAVLFMARELLKELADPQIGVGTGKTSVVLVNRAASTMQVPWQEAEQILNHEMLAIISPAPELCFQAAEAALPIVAFQPNSVIANQMNKLAEELSGRGRPGLAQ